MWPRPDAAAAAAAALAGAAALRHERQQRRPAQCAQQQPPQPRPAAAQTRDGKAVPLPRNVSMTCGADCGGLSELRIVDMEEGRATVDFRAAKGFFECYHRCIASRKALVVAHGTTVEESVLDVEGVGPGVSARWVQAHATELAGRRAVWRVLLATAAADRSSVAVYEAKVPGTIVPDSSAAAASANATANASGFVSSGFASFNRPTDGTEGFEQVFVPDTSGGGGAVGNGGGGGGGGLTLAAPGGMGRDSNARLIAWERHLLRTTPHAVTTTPHLFHCL